MAAALVKTLRKHLDCVEQYRDNSTVLIETFREVDLLVPQYWTEAIKTKQSKEAKLSMNKFAWTWVELPDFPLRKFIPIAARTLEEFPKNRCLVLILADLFDDIGKQVMMNKCQALQEGIVKGFLEAILHVLVVSPPRFSNLKEPEVTFLNACLAAVEKISITPSNGFHDIPLKTKNEFFALGKAAWIDTEDLDSLLGRLPWPEDSPPLEGVNEGLQLLVFLLGFLPPCSEGTNTCLQLIKNVSEGFEATLPVQNNPDFLEYLRKLLIKVRDEIKAVKEEKERLGELNDSALWKFQKRVYSADEALLLVYRTTSPATIPYKHSDVFLHPPFDAFMRKTNNSGRNVNHQIVAATNAVRDKARRKHLEIADKLAKKQKDPRVCTRCGKEWRNLDPDDPKFKKCSRCNEAPYCGPECQSLHWPMHKKECPKKEVVVR